MIESRSGRILGYAALLFLLPVLLGLLGYVIGSWLSLGEGARLALAGGGFLLSFLPVWMYSHFVISRRLDIEIVEIL